MEEEVDKYGLLIKTFFKLNITIGASLPEEIEWNLCKKILMILIEKEILQNWKMIKLIFLKL